jgi:hypothetical protein
MADHPAPLASLLDALAAEPTAANARAVLDAVLSEEVPSDDALRLRRLLDSPAGEALRETAPRFHASLKGIAWLDAAEEKPVPTRSARTASLELDDALRRRGILERAKSFEDEVAELFRLLGYKTVVDYKKDDMQFDVRLEMPGGPLPAWVLVECKDTAAKVGQKDVREFASKVDHLRRAERRNYQAILVSRAGFVNNAHAVAEEQFVELRTYDELLLSLVDLGPHLDAAVDTYRGTALERLYVEQDVVLQSDLEPGEEVRARPIFAAVHDWLERRDAPVLALLGDFGSGKTSFCRRLACELALAAREPSEAPLRRPVLVDLREGGSATVTLENLLTHCFQRLSSRPFQPQALLRLSHEGHLVLLFDGFDEIVGYAEPGRFVEHLRQILRAAAGQAKVILSCRTHYFRDRPEEVRRLGKARDVVSSEGATRLYDELTERPGTEIAYLREFTPKQIDEYLEKALPPPADWPSFRDEIRRTYNLEDLAERPFLLEIIVKTLPRLRDRGEVTLADLYENYCESWFDHTDFRLTLTREHKVALVEYLARLIWDAPGQSVHYQELFEKSTEFFAGKSLTPHDKERIDYEVRTALFLHRDERGYYRFIHRSFLEFFLARTLRAGLDAQDPGCLDLKRLTREVVLFLTFWPEARRIPELAGRVLEEGYRPRVSENALVLLDLWVRSGIAPLVGPGSEVLDRPDVLGNVRERWTEARPRGIALNGAELDGVDLRGADLVGARLKGARLERADLRGARLDGARLGGAALALADLREASLVGVDGTGAVPGDGLSRWGASSGAAARGSARAWIEGSERGLEPGWPVRGFRFPGR